MAIIYVLLRAIAFALTKKAAWKHDRAKKRLEKTDEVFRDAENSCKAEEVAVGRPANFASQFKLMKVFETRDRAHQVWVSAANRLKNRRRFSSWLSSWTGKKVPYSCGLIDMTLVLFAFDILKSNNFDWNNVADFIARTF